MTYYEKSCLLKRLDNLIRMGATGSAHQLASRLEVSRASVYCHLETLKNLGGEISYCPNRKTFYYTSKFQLNT